MADIQSGIQEFSCSELKEGMLILSYTGFDDKLQQLSPKTCQWFKVNFAGCEFKINRSGSELSVSADGIETGDQLIEITSLPEKLKKISVVSIPLKAELERRGFKRFKVAIPIHQKQSNTEKRKHDTENANELIEQVTENIRFREEAAEAIEYFLDSARSGTINEKKIKNFLGELVDKSSTDALSAIASLKKSDQIYGHCIDVSAIFSNIYLKIAASNNLKNAFVDEKELVFASFVHDFGKAKIPKDILESTTHFEINSPEMTAIRNHPAAGAELVSKMSQSNTILNMVLWHHLKLDTTVNSSYPEKPENVCIAPETRLLSIVDAYQALIGRRNYKKAWSPPAAIRYLDALAGIDYDLTAWDNFLKVIGEYPVSSLVELTDKTLAFVVKSSEDNPANPQVVVIQDADGTWRHKHELLDLSDESEINIVRDLDAQDIFGDKALDTFTRIRLV